MSLYFVQKGILPLIGSVRDKNGHTPGDVSRLLLELLQANDNSSNPYDDG